MFISCNCVLRVFSIFWRRFFPFTVLCLILCYNFLIIWVAAWFVPTVSLLHCVVNCTSFGELNDDDDDDDIALKTRQQQHKQCVVAPVASHLLAVINRRRQRSISHAGVPVPRPTTSHNQTSTRRTELHRLQLLYHHRVTMTSGRQPEKQVHYSMQTFRCLPPLPTPTCCFIYTLGVRKLSDDVSATYLNVTQLFRYL